MGKKILIVDDEDDILFILKSVLTRQGYTVKEAYSGEECLELLESHKPDLIFMDIMMPGIDGWEVARKIKTDPKTQNIPISMLSVKSDPEDKEKSLQYSYADEHLNKPVDFEMLLYTAENLLSSNN